MHVMSFQETFADKPTLNKKNAHVDWLITSLNVSLNIKKSQDGLDELKNDFRFSLKFFFGWSIDFVSQTLKLADFLASTFACMSLQATQLPFLSFHEV